MAEASDTEKEQTFGRGRQYVSNFEKYGAPTWYEWRIREWGTKWNACYTEILDKDTVTFKTARSNPARIIGKLGELYPSVEIEHWWAGEGTEINTGIRRLFAGEEEVFCFERDENAYSIYAKCWLGCENVHLNDDGTLQITNCDDCGRCS